MIQVVFDNDIWIELLSVNNKSLIYILKSIKEERIQAQTSTKLLDILKKEIINLYRKQAFTNDLATKYFKIILDISTLNKSVANIPNLLSSKYSPYIELCVATEAEYLIANNYNDFKTFDGYKGINVIELDEFITNIKSWEKLDRNN